MRVMLTALLDKPEPPPKRLSKPRCAELDRNTNSFSCSPVIVSCGTSATKSVEESAEDAGPSPETIGLCLWGPGAFCTA